MAEVWFFIPSAIYWSVLPSLVEAKAVGDALFFERLQKYYNLMALMAYAVAVPTMLLAKWLVPTLFGAAYALQLRLQAARLDVAYQFLQILPYVLTLIVLIFARNRAKQPKEMCVPYEAA